VAARIVEQYHKPAVVISLADGVGQGSARSVPYFELHTALERCREHVISFGGHAMAAGIKIAEACIPAFREAFTRQANNAMSGSAIRPKLRIDGQVGLSLLDERTVTAIHHLGPFGQGNPKPLLASDWLELADEPRCVGRTSEHLQVSLCHNGTMVKGIAFGAAGHAEALKEHRRCRVAFEPIINEFNGRRRVELQVVDFKFPGDA
jgi:single-stranded-DNA-specific exonuclease